MNNSRMAIRFWLGIHQDGSGWNVAKTNGGFGMAQWLVEANVVTPRKPDFLQA